MSRRGIDCSIEICKAPGEIKNFALNGERTVKAAMALAKLTAGSGEIIRVNGSDATKDTELKNGDTVLILKAMKGA